MSLNESPNVANVYGTGEGIFAQSGTEDKPSFDVKVMWEGHNSGSHSEVQILASETAGKSGENLHITLVFNGNGEIASMGDITNTTSKPTRNGNVIEIYRNGHYNAYETFSFMITDIRFTKSQYEGGIGSYYPSGENTHTLANEFTATISSC